MAGLGRPPAAGRGRGSRSVPLGLCGHGQPGMGTGEGHLRGLSGHPAAPVAPLSLPGTRLAAVFCCESQESQGVRDAQDPSPFGFAPESFVCQRLFPVPRRAQPSPQATSPIHHSPHAAVKCQLLGEACFGFPGKSCASPSPGRIQDHPRAECFREKQDFSRSSGSACSALCVPGEPVGNGGSWGAETPKSWNQTFPAMEPWRGLGWKGL